MGILFFFGAITFLIGSYTFDYESDSRGVVLGYATAVLFTAGSVGFIIPCFLIFKIYFGGQRKKAVKTFQSTNLEPL